MRMTRQRKVLLEIINQAGTPLSAEEIMQQARQQARWQVQRQQANPQGQH